VDQSAPKTLHHIELEALVPDTTYHYRIQSGEAEAGPFTFSTAGDGAFSFAVFGDSRTSAEQSAGVGRQMASHNPRFLLHSGDLVSNGTVYEQWEEQFFTPLKEVINRIPIFPVLGNHEQNSEHFYNFFPSGSWYAFDYGNALFIALNTNAASGGFEPGSEQYAWLERTLSESSALWRIVWFHHPPYSSGNHGCSMAQQEAFAPLFEQYQVDVVFNGHDHIYERSFPMRARRRDDESGVIYVVTGGGGAPLYHVDAGEWTAFATSTHHCCIVSLDGPHLRWQTYDLNGDVVDYRWLCKDPAFVSEQINGLENPSTRPEAIFNLGALCHRKSVPALMPFAKDSDAQIRKLAAEALARMGEPWTRETLEGLTAETEVETVRLAAFGLALIARKTPSRLLVDLLNHSDEQVRRHASQGLKFVPTDWARNALAGAIDDSDAIVRRNITRALAPVSHEVDIAVWQTALADEDTLARTPAFQAIRELEDITDVLDLLHDLLTHEHTGTRRAVAQVLIAKPQMESVEFLLSAFNDDDARVRQYAGQALQALAGESLEEHPEVWRWWFEQERGPEA
jgi:HEAT repeat protein/3',5'-cyclic AMP phosphodiesterase CpdA